MKKLKYTIVLIIMGFLVACNPKEDARNQVVPADDNTSSLNRRTTREISGPVMDGPNQESSTVRPQESRQDGKQPTSNTINESKKKKNNQSR